MREFAAIAFVCAILLSGCDQEPQPQQVPVAISNGPETRFEVTKVAEFNDAYAYRGTRGIFVIHDRTTGREYIGVSGVGISEVGAHQSGKHTVTDER